MPIKSILTEDNLFFKKIKIGVYSKNNLIINCAINNFNNLLLKK